MTDKQLVIVESPAKAKTINKYLGPDYIVMATMGHIRDLPNKNPKGTTNPVPGVDLDKAFKPTYEIIKGRGTILKNLKKAAKEAVGIWLATDLDREGEAIAWHLIEALKIDQKKVKRVVFNAITKREIEKAFQNPHLLDMGKVNAQQARRILDRIVGYQVSPLLWKKVAGGLSAGRVQSVATRLIVEREREIEAFIPDEYWRIHGYFTTDIENVSVLSQKWFQWLEKPSPKISKTNGSERAAKEKNAWLSNHNAFAAELTEIDGKKFFASDSSTALSIAEMAGFKLEEKHEQENPHARGPAKKTVILKGQVQNGPDWKIKSIETKRTKSRPSAPFITSTLQQSAANQFNFPAQRTMRLAQDLYEGMELKGLGSVGLITYMRTDSTHLSNDSIKMARTYIKKEFGDRYLPEKANTYVSSNKSAQEAHEAIRPTDIELTPDRIKASLSDRHYKLYKMIWERFLSCQMIDAQWDLTTVFIAGWIKDQELIFRASGRVLVFDGFYRVSGIPNHSDEAILPELIENQPLAALQINPVQNFTNPPPRYTEASLVKKLEAEGIGRPSTYAQIIQVIQGRKYVQKQKNRFYATDLGKVVTDKLIEAFPDILEVGYTRDMEQQLDDVEEKQADWVDMLQHFYGDFKESLDSAYVDLQHAKAEIEPAPHKCPECGSGTVYRFGRNGRFLSCATYPECKYAAPIDREGNPVEPEKTDVACPQCGSSMLLRKGRFGPFLSCSKYPECNGILNLDKKGQISPPKTPPLRTDLKCPKCQSWLNLRRGARGPWLSCSKFPKCRGRLGWTTLDDKVKAHWIKALEQHEKSHPQPVIKDLEGNTLDAGHTPQVNPFEDIASLDQ
jgi:DNA topoisomerase-1